MQVDNKEYLKYPILGLKKNDNNIYVFKKNFGLVSVGGEHFYKDLTIINSEGVVLYCDTYKIKGRASIKECLLYFQKMLKLDVNLRKEQESISLNDLKEKIIDHINKKPKKWLVLDTIEGIQSRVNNSKTYSELILIFR